VVTYFGLNTRLGNISYYDSTGQQEYSFTKPYSEKTAEAIDEEVHKLAEDAYKRALKILEDNIDKLKQLAQRLLDEEVIFAEDVEAIFGPRPFEDKDKHEVAKSISSEFKEKQTKETKENGKDAKAPEAKTEEEPPAIPENTEQEKEANKEE
jgi:cell division protease FtsH